MTLLPAFAFGLVLGLRHATDADHVAAIGTLAFSGGSARRAAMIGAWWGLGHSASVLLVGGLLVLLQTPMPPRLALAFEFAVGMMLIVLGVRALLTRRDAARTDEPALRPLLVGLMHGLAGSAVLVLLLIGATPNAGVALAYLACFGIGTIAGMAGITCVLALPSRLHPARAPLLQRRLRVAAGVSSVVVGVLLAHRVGFEEGLFAATLTVTP